jgi:GDPmannose 4,6-dehydratase
MIWKGKNVLITGISGFAGSYLADKLLEYDVNVFGLIRKRADGIAKNLVDHGITHNVNLIEGDLTDITSIANSLD